MKSKKEPTLIHVIIGVDHAEKDMRLAAIKKQHPALSDDFGIERFDTKTHTIAEVLSKARTFPFCSDIQLFIVRVNKKILKADRERIQQYLEDPPSCTILVFDCEESDKELSAAFKGMSCVSVYDGNEMSNDVGTVVARMVRQHGKTMSPHAIRVFRERNGEHLDTALQYLEQLLLYVGPRPEITADDVTEIVRESLSYNSFALANALVARQCDRVLTLMRDMMGNGYSVQELIAQIHWQLKRVYSAKRMMQRGEQKGEIGRSLRIGPRYVDGFLRDVRRFSMDAISSALKDLAMLDYKIKRGQVDPVIGIEQYVVMLVR